MNISKNNKTKVAVAMSGGVDSSVAAFLLKQQGYDVFGVFMKFWSDEEVSSKQNLCCSYKSFLDAKKIADKLNIPLYTINFKEQFKKKIVDDFLIQYGKCQTPNPCVQCNKYIKFDLLLQKVKKLGADFLATGHYVRIKKDKKGFFHLSKSKDKEKDQTYFLYNLSQKQLKHLLFPIGKYVKKDVKEIARQNDLLVFSKPESQEICFIGSQNLNDFLGKYLKIKKGKIIDLDTKKEMGEHLGLAFYTIGQRKGIGLGGGPYFVIKKDKKKNILYISKNQKNLFANKLEAVKINWLNPKEIKFPLTAKAKIRYRTNDEKVLVTQKNKNTLIVQFAKPVKSITSGQSIVFYDKNELIGGGIIK